MRHTPNQYCTTHTRTLRGGLWWNACVCVFVFPAIVRRRLIPPLFTDRRLSELPELIIKSNNINSQTLSASLPVCLSTVNPHISVVSSISARQEADSNLTLQRRTERDFETLIHYVRWMQWNAAYKRLVVPGLVSRNKRKVEMRSATRKGERSNNKKVGNQSGRALLLSECLKSQEM